MIFTAKGLILRGQNYLIYPGATLPECDLDKPGFYGLDYEDLELLTSDGVTLRCYLLLQQRLNDLDTITDKEVRYYKYSRWMRLTRMSGSGFTANSNNVSWQRM